MTSFSDLSLDPRVLQAVIESGYTTPTPIQEQAIPHALAGRDVLGIAQTGTGKTASFVLPMITLLSKGRARARMPRSLVLAPTRELAAQVAEQFEKYSANVKLTMALLIGGVSFKDQDRLIDRGVDVLIATPGRLLDHHERGKLMLTGVQIMVVDEADRMLDMGFIPDIERIFKLVPFTRQTLFFSATMAPEITRITQEFLHNPERVEVSKQASTSETITQVVCIHKPSRKEQANPEKRDVLRHLIRSESESLTNGIIFCNRKRDVDIVAKSLKQHGFDAAALHGDLDQKLRMEILAKFRDGDLKLLIASDVAARGLDIPSVSHVFNFDVPIHSEDYVHRIGRTGRAGREGKSITLCLPFEEKYLAKIEELVNKPIPRIPSPLEATPTAEEPRSAKTDSEPDRKPASTSRSRSRSKPAAEPRNEPATEPRETKAMPAPTSGNQQSRPPRRQNGNYRGSNGPTVLGMGDHVPAFLTRDFRVTMSETDESDELEIANSAVEADQQSNDADQTTASAAADAETDKPAKKPARRATRSRSRKPKPAEAAADPATETTETESAEPQVSTENVTEESGAVTEAEAPASPEAPATEEVTTALTEAVTPTSEEKPAEAPTKEPAVEADQAPDEASDAEPTNPSAAA